MKNNRRQFLVGCGAVATVAAFPPIARSAPNAYDVVRTQEIPGLGSILTLSFARPLGGEPVSIVAAVLDRRNAKARIVADPMPIASVRKRPSEPPALCPQLEPYPVIHVDRADLREGCAFAPSASQVDGTQTQIDHIEAQYFQAASQLSTIAGVHHAPIAVNGGFYDLTSFAPNGLLIVDGKTLSPLNSKLPGVFSVDANGIPSLGQTSGFAARPYAVQGGPFLLNFPGIAGEPLGDAVAGRTFVAAAGDTFVAATAGGISLRDLADLLALYPDAFGVAGFDAALNLGGGLTSGFFARAGDITVSRTALMRSVDAILFGAPG